VTLLAIVISSARDARHGPAGWGCPPSQISQFRANTEFYRENSTVLSGISMILAMKTAALCKYMARPIMTADKGSRPQHYSSGKIQPDLWTCPVNPHLMYIWCNIYLFIYHNSR
jgi:hypothetical protein